MPSSAELLSPVSISMTGTEPPRCGALPATGVIAVNGVMVGTLGELFAAPAAVNIATSPAVTDPGRRTGDSSGTVAPAAAIAASSARPLSPSISFTPLDTWRIWFVESEGVKLAKTAVVSPELHALVRVASVGLILAVPAAVVSAVPGGSLLRC